MKTKSVLTLGGSLGLFILVATATLDAAQNLPTADAGASIGTAVARLTEEVNALRREVLQLRLEVEQSRLETLQRELRDADEELRQLGLEERGLTQEVEDLRKQLLEPTLTDGQRAEITATIAAICNDGAAKLQAEWAAAQRKEAAARDRHGRAQAGYSQLLSLAAALGLSPTRAAGR